jgi:type VI secretion system secreted protein VgrG
LAVSAPQLGPDDLLLVGFSGQESISRLFSFHLDLLAENKTTIAFDKLLGQSITVELELPGSRGPRDKKRYFNGICNRICQGERDHTFTHFRMELVPELWLLSKRAQSRTFQHVSVPDILKKVLGKLKNKVVYKLEGTFEQRDYCVQYRESDFAFASRLMEEEGIYYYFQFQSGSHTLVLANTPTGHVDMPVPATVTYKDTDGIEGAADTIYDWGKVQELRAGKYTLWDHSFELPHKHLEASKTIQPDVQVGQTTHKLKVGANDPLEIYDFPGGYAQRFDGVDKGGGNQAGDLQKIFKDNQRTVEIRMQEESAASVLLQGAGNCRHFVVGHKFTLNTLPDTLEKQFQADGTYVLTTLRHDARLPGDYRSTGGEGFTYHNSFSCIPAKLPYRPQRTTARPVVQGTQTAVVVGPPGEEIFTDKYGRVKVQFHWDREGKNNADSSCWCRVATPWAGKQWGAIHIPRVGQEVVVAFQEGDPDQPLIVGSVYNAEMMLPYTLPDNKTQSGLKTRSSMNGSPSNFNELRFEDKKDSEDIVFHAEKDFHRSVENDDDLKVGHDQTIEIKNNRTETVKEGDEQVTIKKGNRTVMVETGDDLHQIKQGNRAVKIDMGDDSLTISMGDQTTKLDLGKSETEAMQSIELKVGQSSIKLDQMGVTIKGMTLNIEGQIQTQVKGAITQINGEGMLQLQGGVMMIN